MADLLPKADIPKEFNLTAAPNDEGKTVVTFTSEKGTRELGRFPSDVDGTILLKMLPDMKVNFMIEMALKSFKLPKSFVARAYPDDEEIVFSFSVPLKDGADPWTKEKRIKINEWDLAQMGDLLSWVKEARKLDN